MEELSSDAVKSLWAAVDVVLHSLARFKVRLTSDVWSNEIEASETKRNKTADNCGKRLDRHTTI